MNWKWCGRKRSGLNLRHCPGVCLEIARISRKHLDGTDTTSRNVRNHQALATTTHNTRIYTSLQQHTTTPRTWKRITQKKTQYTVMYRFISRQRPKYAQSTIEKVLQEMFSMGSAPCPLLGNGSLNTFPQKQTRGAIGDLLLDNGAAHSFCQQYRLCFPWGPCKLDVGESSSEAGSCGRTRIEGVQRSTTELACEKKTWCVL
jgi:hypothetical protein